MMFGVHITLSPDKLAQVVELRKQGKIKCPEGMKIIEEYVYGFQFLVIIIKATDPKVLMDFTKQFSQFATNLEVGVVTTLKDLASR